MTTRYDVTGTQGMFEPSSKEKVLANKLGIVNPADMDEAELVLLQKLYESVLQEHLPTGRISANHLKIWHRRWLGNVYAWAGHLRSVNMSKDGFRSEEHTSELQSLMRIPYPVFFLKKK